MSETAYGPLKFTDWVATIDRHELDRIVCYMYGYSPRTTLRAVAHVMG